MTLPMKFLLRWTKGGTHIWQLHTSNPAPLLPLLPSLKETLLGF